MKNVYIGLASILASGFVFGQKVTTNPMNDKKIQTFESKAKKEIYAEPKGITLWSSDFSVPADWVTSNAPAPGGSPGHTAGDWAITTDVNAAPRPELTPAGHTSAANGYALIDSDGAGATETQNAKIVTANSIDLTGQPLVVLVFQQTHRRYAESTFVVYSTDGGAVWQEIEVNDMMGTNTNTANPGTVQVNMSAYLGNQANVKIGFKYIGQYDWFWAVDDVKLMTPDDYDLSMDGGYWGSTGFWGARLPYYQIPLAQLAPIDVSGIVSNLGALTQTDIVFTAALASGAWSGSSAASTIVAGALDTLSLPSSLTPPPAAATHVINFSAASGAVDAAPANNSILSAATIVVNNSIYARDKNNVSGGSYNAGFGFEVGNIFDIYATAPLSAIDVYIGDAAEVGAECYVKLYSIDATTGDFVYVDESNAYTLTTNDLDGIVTFSLAAGAFTLNAGESYLVVAGSNGDGGLTNDLVVGTSGNSEVQTSFYLDLTDNTWYYTTSTPMVRMNFSAAGIEDNDASFGMNVYPNPAENEANISVSVENANVAVTLTDLSGKVVYNNNLGTVNGTKNVTINTSNFANGIYMVGVNSNGNISTKKLVIRN
jgi:hypothetical protein